MGIPVDIRTPAEKVWLDLHQYTSIPKNTSSGGMTGSLGIDYYINDICQSITEKKTIANLPVLPKNQHRSW